MTSLWRAVDGEVRVPLAEAEWWGASLAVLMATIHHPDLLAERQPRTDPAKVAREVLAGLPELRAAAATAQAHVRNKDDWDRLSRASVRAVGDEAVLAPGGEVANLVWCIEIFATGVLEPQSSEATVARGATAYAASAWAGDIGKASGSL